jgi:hypothetical protein
MLILRAELFKDAGAVMAGSAHRHTHRHTHRRTHRRRRREGSDSGFLHALREACVDRGLSRLGELVHGVLVQRWRDQSSAPLNPELVKRLLI